MIFRKMLSGPDPDEFIPGDWVQRYGFRRIGLVEAVNSDHATVLWRDGSKETGIPFTLLKRAKNRDYDKRRGE